MSGLSDRVLEQAMNAIKFKDFLAAEQQLTTFIMLEPEATDGWVLLGNVLSAQKRWFLAACMYDRALSIRESLRDAWSNRGTCFAQLGNEGEATRSFKCSIEVKDTAEPHLGLANIYHAQARLEDCERELRTAIELDNAPGTHVQLGLVLLGQGRWKESFEEYAYRWIDNPAASRAMRDIEPWQGQSVASKSIVLCPEQGYGDEIMGYRFANLFKAMGAAKVSLMARQPLLELAKTLDKIDEVIPLHGEIPKADYSCALLDVPQWLGMGPFDIPRPHKYLSVPYKDRVTYWDQKLRAPHMPEGIKVGVCWSSGTALGLTAEASIMKSVPVWMLKSLVRPGVNLISLQRGGEHDPSLGIFDWMGEVEDFGDTAALIEACDCVVSVDTSVAHVAGAIGKPVANLVRYAGFFPWLAPDRAPHPAYSIWYPSMTLLRQSSLGNWAEPLKQASQFISTILEAVK